MLWRTPSVAQTYPLGSPWEMAVSTERWLVEGAGARFLPGMDVPARDGDSFVFVDDTWPSAFQTRVGDSVFLRVSPTTGCYDFEDANGTVFWTVVPYAPLTWNWISPFRSPLHPDEQNLYSPFRLVREWRLSTPEIEEMRMIPMRRVPLRSAPAAPVTNLCFTAFSITNDVLFFTADWPTNEPLPGCVLDVWCSTNLSEWAWTNIWSEPATNPSLSFTLSRTLVPNYGSVSPHVHEPTCSPSTNVVVSPLDGTTVYTNETWSCETNRNRRVEPAFFQLGTRADNDNDGIVDTWEKFVYGTNPNSDDTDGDGINDGTEQMLGTDPLNPDTDGDTMPDGWEIANGLNPIDFYDSLLDSDADGLIHVYEYHAGTDLFVADYTNATRTIVGGTNSVANLRIALETSDAYDISELPAGVHAGADWTGLRLPDHPVLVTSADGGRARDVVLQAGMSSSYAAFWSGENQSEHMMFQGITLVLAGNDHSTPIGFYVGSGETVPGTGTGHGSFFRNVSVVLGNAAEMNTGWYLHHQGKRKVLLSECFIEGRTSRSPRGVYSLDGPDILIENTTFANFPAVEGEACYGIHLHGSLLDGAPAEVIVANCLFDTSFSNAFPIARGGLRSRHHSVLTDAFFLANRMKPHSSPTFRPISMCPPSVSFPAVIFRQTPISILPFPRLRSISWTSMVSQSRPPVRSAPMSPAFQTAMPMTTETVFPIRPKCSNMGRTRTCRTRTATANRTPSNCCTEVIRPTTPPDSFRFRFSWTTWKPKESP